MIAKLPANVLQYEISEIGIGGFAITIVEPSSKIIKGLSKGGLKFAPKQLSSKIIVKVYRLYGL